LLLLFVKAILHYVGISNATVDIIALCLFVAKYFQSIIYNSTQ